MKAVFLKLEQININTEKSKEFKQFLKEFKIDTLVTSDPELLLDRFLKKFKFTNIFLIQDNAYLFSKYRVKKLFEKGVITGYVLNYKPSKSLLNLFSNRNVNEIRKIKSALPENCNFYIITDLKIRDCYLRGYKLHKLKELGVLVPFVKDMNDLVYLQDKYTPFADVKKRIYNLNKNGGELSWNIKRFLFFELFSRKGSKWNFTIPFFEDSFLISDEMNYFLSWE